MIISINYPAGHRRTEKWEPCDLFCPMCGVKKVWLEQSLGDYYCGPEYICIECSHRFTIQGPYKIEQKDITSFRVLDVLKSVT